jgi:hypothetical protein
MTERTESRRPTVGFNADDCKHTAERPFRSADRSESRQTWRRMKFVSTGVPSLAGRERYPCGCGLGNVRRIAVEKGQCPDGYIFHVSAN